MRPFVHLIMQCLGSYKKRPEAMVLVKRALEHIKLQHSTQRAVLAALAEQEEKREGVLRTCLVCYDEVREARGVACSAIEEGHFLCEGCFQAEVCTQVSDEELGSFAENSKSIVCRICMPPKRPSFGDAVVARHVPEDIFKLYRQAGEKVLIFLLCFSAGVPI